jgi:hypothetical protein
MASKLDQPYRQRVYHLSIKNDSTITSEVYTFKSNALKYAGEWKKANPLEGVSLRFSGGKRRMHYLFA